jgi:signal transduction histidine kinase
VDSLIRASRSGGALDEAALSRVDAVGASESDADGLVGEVLTVTLDAVSCDHTLLLLRTSEDDLRLHTLLDEGVVIGMPFTESGSVLDAALGTGRPMVVGGVGERDDAGAILAQMFRAREVALAPLQVGAETIGVLGAVDPVAGAFDDADLATLRVVAGRAAVAFSFARVVGALRSEIDDSGSLLGKLSGSDQNEADLLSVVSHEVKSPMNNIIGFGRVLRDEWSGLPNERRRHYLDVMIREAQRAARLVEDVLDLARLESGSLARDLQPVSMRDVIDEVLVANQAACSSHDVVVELDPDLPPALADPDRLGQVLRNLVSNACLYAPAGTRVTIRATRIRAEDGPTLLVSVTDEGPGIPEAEWPGLFEKFTRLSTSKGAVKGSGLGLFISRGIIEAHGGRIWLKSQPGEGSTFFFTVRPA